MHKNKTVLVTGVSSLIGMGISEFLSKRGFRVFGTARCPEGTYSWPGNIEMVSLDVRSRDSIQSCVQHVLDASGRIDAVVNNAGYALMGALEETSIEEARDVFETNFFGILQLNQIIMPIMRRQGHGRIVNIGSAAGFLPAPYSGIYAASKSALEGYSQALDHEVRRLGIRVSVVEPGFIRTALGQHTLFSKSQIEAYARERAVVVAAVERSIASGENPSVVAAAVFEALTAQSPRTKYLAGRAAKVASFLKWVMPSSFMDRGVRSQFGMT